MVSLVKNPYAIYLHCDGAMNYNTNTGTTGGSGTSTLYVYWLSGYGKSNIRVLDYQVYALVNVW